MKYVGNPKYVDQLVNHYNQVNTTINQHRNYVNLTESDKVRLAQEEYVVPGTCCLIYVIWNTWQDSSWDLNTHEWGTKWSV